MTVSWSSSATYKVRPVVNAAGESRITAGDFAAAFVDELETNRFSRQRFTAGS